MGKFSINEEGQLVNESGEPIEIDGEAVTLEGYLSQDQVNKTVKERLARERKNLDDLKSAAEQVPELQKQVKEREALVAELEEKARDAEQQAQDKVSQQIRKAKEEAETLRTSLDNERRSHVRTQVTNQILGVAGDRFIDPISDIVPKLLENHKREPVLDDNGKPVEGKFNDIFSVPVIKKNEEDGTENEVVESLPVDKAVEAVASHPKFRHYVRSQNNAGSGGAKYGKPSKSVDTKNIYKWSTREKLDFIDEYGDEAYKDAVQKAAVAQE